MFRDIVSKYLNLPAEQHELLTSDLKIEDALKKYRKQKRFKYIFDYQKDLMENLRNLRVIQRPLFALMERTNKDLSKVRDIGEKAGLKFPDSAPVKKDGEGSMFLALDTLFQTSLNIQIMKTYSLVLTSALLFRPMVLI